VTTAASKKGKDRRRSAAAQAARDARKCPVPQARTVHVRELLTFLKSTEMTALVGVGVVARKKDPLAEQVRRLSTC